MATDEELRALYERKVVPYRLSWLKIALLEGCLQIGDSIWKNLKLKHKCIVLILRDRGAL